MTEAEFHIPVDEIAAHAPFPLRGEVKKILHKLDELDMNHDGKRDVAQAVKLALVIMPLADKLNDAVDFDKLAEWLVKQDFVKNEAVAKEIILTVCHAIEKV